MTKSESSHRQQVVSVTPDVHAEYIEEAEPAGGEVTTSGSPESRRSRRSGSGAQGPPAQLPCKQPGPLRQYLLMEIPTHPTPDATPPAAELEFHPAAALFPLLEVERPELGELVHDIREHGLLQPIVLCDGKILDGRSR